MASGGNPPRRALPPEPPPFGPYPSVIIGVMGRPKLYHTDEERREARRRTVAKYDRSEKGKAATARANASPLAKERYARYRTTEKYRAAQERRRIKDQATGWPNQLAQRRHIRAHEPNKVNAWMAVRWAMEFGLLTRPDACERCGSTKKLHAHHHLGYERDHWLDVQWLCSPCHRVTHR